MLTALFLCFLCYHIYEEYFFLRLMFLAIPLYHILKLLLFFIGSYHHIILAHTCCVAKDGRVWYTCIRILCIFAKRGGCLCLPTVRACL